MIDKATATTNAAAFSTAFSTRVDSYLQSQASVGILGGLIVVPKEVANADAIAARTALLAGGWTVDIDVPNRILLIK